MRAMDSWGRRLKALTKRKERRNGGIKGRREGEKKRWREGGEKRKETSCGFPPKKTPYV